MTESQAYQCGMDISERWGIGLYEAQNFLIKNDYWKAVHKPHTWKNDPAREA
jgi:hypothetical protein